MFFDTTSRSICTVKPTRTNTPLHALATMNDITYVEAARALGELAKRRESSDEETLDDAFRRVLARRPTAVERQLLLAGYARVRDEFSRDPASASRLMAAGRSSRDDQPDDVERAAWTAICLAIFNLDEALTKE